MTGKESVFACRDLKILIPSVYCHNVVLFVEMELLFLSFKNVMITTLQILMAVVKTAKSNRDMIVDFLSPANVC